MNEVVKMTAKDVVGQLWSKESSEWNMRFVITFYGIPDFAKVETRTKEIMEKAFPDCGLKIESITE